LEPDLRSNILAFYSNPSAPLATKKEPADWQKTKDELEKLRSLPDSAAGSKNTAEIITPDPARLRPVSLPVETSNFYSKR
jgi:hypothetical protein